jgi:hypothetical protein
MYLGFTPFLPLESKAVSGTLAYSGAYLKLFNTSMSQKSEKKQIITFCLDLALIQICNLAYNLVGIYLEKTGCKHKWHKLYFTQQKRTDNNSPVFKCCILHKIIARYIKNSASSRISRLFSVQNECSFSSIRER